MGRWRKTEELAGDERPGVLPAARYREIVRQIAQTRHRTGTVGLAFVLPLEVEIGEVHVALGEDVDGEDVFAGLQVKARDGGCEIPVMPLAPGDCLRGI